MLTYRTVFVPSKKCLVKLKRGPFMCMFTLIVTVVLFGHISWLTLSLLRVWRHTHINKGFLVSTVLCTSLPLPADLPLLWTLPRHHGLGCVKTISRPLGVSPVSDPPKTRRKSFLTSPFDHHLTFHLMSKEFLRRNVETTVMSITDEDVPMGCLSLVVESRPGVRINMGESYCTSSPDQIRL